MAELSPIRVAALTGGRLLPSARFRVRQHISGLQKLGLWVDEYFPPIARNAPIPGWPKPWRQGWAGPGLAAWLALKSATQLKGMLASRKAHITWLQRSLLAGIPSFEGLLRRPLVLDIDDAIWLTPPLGRKAMLHIGRRADLILAGNSYLADFFSGLGTAVQILPTAVDTQRFRPIETRPDGPFTLGWIGTSGNLPYLQAIAAPLGRFLQQHRDARLLVCCDPSPTVPAMLPKVLSEVPASQLSFVPWSESSEVATLQSLDVGLMPLPDTSWTRGKCSYKMLQYMACAIPVLVSPIGMNQEILALGECGLAATTPQDWHTGLETLHKNAGKQGQVGRRIVEEGFSLAALTPKLAASLRTIHVGPT